MSELTWSHEPAPQDGTRIVAMGWVNREISGRIEALPFCAHVYFNVTLNEWIQVGPDPMTGEEYPVCNYVGDELTITAWINPPVPVVTEAHADGSVTIIITA